MTRTVEQIRIGIQSGPKSPQSDFLAGVHETIRSEQDARLAEDVAQAVRNDWPRHQICDTYGITPKRMTRSFEEKVELMAVIAQGHSIDLIAEMRHVQPTTIRRFIAANAPAGILPVGSYSNADRAKARVDAAKAWLIDRGTSFAPTQAARAPVQSANRSCGYYIPSERKVCGAPCTGTYCETHLAATHPYGEGHMDEVMSAKFPIREVTP